MCRTLLSFLLIGIVAPCWAQQAGESPSHRYLKSDPSSAAKNLPNLTASEWLKSPVLRELIKKHLNQSHQPRLERESLLEQPRDYTQQDLVERLSEQLNTQPFDSARPGRNPLDFTQPETGRSRIQRLPGDSPEIESRSAEIESQLRRRFQSAANNDTDDRDDVPPDSNPIQNPILGEPPSLEEQPPRKKNPLRDLGARFLNRPARQTTDDESRGSKPSPWGGPVEISPLPEVDKNSANVDDDPHILGESNDGTAKRKNPFSVATKALQKTIRKRGESFPIPKFDVPKLAPPKIDPAKIASDLKSLNQLHEAMEDGDDSARLQQQLNDFRESGIGALPPDARRELLEMFIAQIDKSASQPRDNSPATNGAPSNAQSQTLGNGKSGGNKSLGDDDVSRKIVDSVLEAVDEVGTDWVKSLTDSNKNPNDLSWLFAATDKAKQGMNKFSDKLTQLKQHPVVANGSEFVKSASPTTSRSPNAGLLVLLFVALGSAAWIFRSKAYSEPVKKATDHLTKKVNWPAVADRQSLVDATHQVASARCGREFKFWGQSQLFAKLRQLSKYGARTSADDELTTLSRVYQLARYLPPDEPLSGKNIDDARKVLQTIYELDPASRETAT